MLLNCITCDESSLKHWNVVGTVPCIQKKGMSLVHTCTKNVQAIQTVTPVMFVKQVTTVYMYFLTFYSIPNASICECALYGNKSKKSMFQMVELPQHQRLLVMQQQEHK